MKSLVNRKTVKIPRIKLNVYMPLKKNQARTVFGVLFELLPLFHRNYYVG